MFCVVIFNFDISLLAGHIMSYTSNVQLFEKLHFGLSILQICLLVEITVYENVFLCRGGVAGVWVGMCACVNPFLLFLQSTCMHL